MTDERENNDTVFLMNVNDNDNKRFSFILVNKSI